MARRAAETGLCGRRPVGDAGLSQAKGVGVDLVDAEGSPGQAVTGGLSLSILGGTGPQGVGLGRRFAIAGHRVVLGSRSADRAAAAARALDLPAGSARVTGSDNATAAHVGDVVVVAVPYDGHRGLLASLANLLDGKIVIDCVNPLGFDRRGAFPLAVAAGSAAQEAAEVLPGARVVAAFHHVSAVLLSDPALAEVETDVLVAGDDRRATDVVIGLADSVPGMRGRYVGPLRLAAALEALTANLIAVNRRYRCHAGVRLSGVEAPHR